MAKAPLHAVVREIRHLATVHEARDQSDGALLDAFRSDNDQPAFTELVSRHAPMVLSVCRRVLHHAQDAEDAFQATFLLLARQADSIRKTESLASWLHGVAYRMATNARRAASRRRHYENQTPSTEPPNPAWSAAWREVQAILDEEIDRLPEIYHLPFVLCCLENKSGTEVAQQLGLKEGTVGSRVARARKKLQERLSKRGVSLGAVLGAAAVSGNTALSAVPPALIALTVKVAGQRAAPGAASDLVSPSVAALLGGMSKALAFPKLKAALLLLLAALAVGVAGAVLPLQRQASADPAEPLPEAAPKEQPTKRDAETARPRASLEEKGDTITVRGRVVDPDGKPCAGAKLYLWVVPNFEKPVPPKFQATTGPDGRFDFTFAKQEIAALEQWLVNSRPEPWHQALIVAAAPGYGAAWAGMAQALPQYGAGGAMPVPFGKDDVVLRLVKDDVPVKGRIRDLQGRPVVGAVIRVKKINNLHAPAWEGLKELVTTDQDGQFILTGIGRNRTATLRIAAPAIQLQLVGVDTSTAAGATLDLIAGPAKPVVGTIRASDTGQPLPGVVVYAKHTDLGNFELDPHGVRGVTDEQGRYRLEGLPKAGRYEIAVYPRRGQSYLSATRWIEGTEGLKPITVDFALRRGVTVRFRLIDQETRKPVRGFVQYTLARSNPLWGEALAPYDPRMILPPFFVRCHAPDQDGFIQFVAYPGHGVIYAQVGWGGERYLKARLDPEDEKKGYHPLSKGEPNNGFVHLGNAYRVIDTEKTDKPLTFDLAVTRGRTLQGKLVGPDSKPVTGAMAYGLTFDAAALFRDPSRDPPLAAEGLPTHAFTALGLYPKEPRTLSFAHQDRKLMGYVVVHGTEEGPLTLRLEPWGALTGRLIDDQDKPVAGVILRLHYPDLPRPGFLWQDLEFRTDSQGRFRVECLLPGLKHGLSVVGDAKRALTPTAPEKLNNLSVQAGEVMDLGDVRVKVVPVK
jgi:RNA polymerase sigma factor (sigma-70 family)